MSIVETKYTPIDREELKRLRADSAELARLRHVPEGFALVPVESAAADVLAERKRQIEAEGWTPEHDDKLNGCELAAAAACYAVGSIDTYTRGVQAWPWHVGWWKPDGGYRRMLIKSGALLLAEIERLDRAVIARSAERR